MSGTFADPFGGVGFNSSSSSSASAAAPTASPVAGEPTTEQLLANFVKGYDDPTQLFGAKIDPRDGQVKELPVQIGYFETRNKTTGKATSFRNEVKITGENLDAIKQTIFNTVIPKIRANAAGKKAKMNIEALSTNVGTKNTAVAKRAAAQAELNAALKQINADMEARIAKKRARVGKQYENEDDLFVTNSKTGILRTAKPEERAAKIEEEVNVVRTNAQAKRTALIEEAARKANISTKDAEISRASTAVGNLADRVRAFLAPIVRVRDWKGKVFQKTVGEAIQQGYTKFDNPDILIEWNKLKTSIKANTTDVATRQVLADAKIRLGGGRSRRHKKTHKRSKKSKTRKN